MDCWTGQGGLISLMDGLGGMVRKFKECEPVDPNPGRREWLWVSLGSSSSMPMEDNKLSKLTDIEHRCWLF